jgi:hypothetical protein
MQNYFVNMANVCEKVFSQQAYMPLVDPDSTYQM